MHFFKVCAGGLMLYILAALQVDTTSAANLRGIGTAHETNCSPLSAPYQGSVSVTGTTVGSRATFSCMRGTYMTGSSSSTCTHNGTWSNQPPTCRVEYLRRVDNTFRNGDKGYKLYSG